MALSKHQEAYEKLQYTVVYMFFIIFPFEVSWVDNSMNVAHL